MTIVYGSVCSGIEAATMAWHPLGWQAKFFSEIEAFPSAVLAHHYGSNMPGEDLAKNGVPNYGDFTQIPESAGPIDLLVGGTPCQSFSVAGKRLGLDDPRGNLALEYLRLARRLGARWIVWENVPGVLSSVTDEEDGESDVRSGLEGRAAGDEWIEESDFATFLSFVRECGYGFAYRILDAQYVRVDGFARAVPQRRRRVFLVGYLGDWRRAAAILLEPEGLRGDPAPRREAWKGVADPTFQGAAVSSGQGWWEESDVGATIRAQDSITKADTLVAFGGGNRSGPCAKQVVRAAIISVDGRVFVGENDCASPQKVCPRGGMASGEGYHLCKDICRQTGHAEINALKKAGDAARGATLYLEGHSYVCDDCKRACDDAGIAEIVVGAEPMQLAFGGGNRSGSIDVSTAHGHRIDFEVETFVAHALWAEGFDASEDGTGRGTPIVPVIAPDTAATLTRGAESAGKGGYAGRRQEDDHNIVAYAIDSDCIDRSGEGAGGTAGERSGLGITEGVSSALRAKRPNAVAFAAQAGGKQTTLGYSDDGSCQTLSAHQTPAVAFDLRGREGGAAFEGPHDTANIRAASGGSSRSYVAERWAVRRLMPGECERLQGFPVGFTDVPWRGKQHAPDGPRYKALGNSMAVNVMRWIGERIDLMERLDREGRLGGRAER